MTKVLVSDPIDQAGLDILNQVAQVDQRIGLSEDELVGIIGEYDGLMIRSGTQVTATVIAAANRLPLPMHGVCTVRMRAVHLPRIRSDCQRAR